MTGFLAFCLIVLASYVFWALLLNDDQPEPWDGVIE